MGSGYSKDYYKRYKIFDSDKAADFIVKNLGGFFKNRPDLACAGNAIDIGCGLGRLTYRLRDYSDLVIGIDLSADALKLAKRGGGKKLFFVQGNTLKLPIREGSCQLCTCMHVIEHIKEPDVLLREIYRIIGDRGIFVLVTPNKRWTRFCPPSLKDKTHIREFSVVELKALVSKYFHIERITPFSMFTSFGLLNPLLNAAVKPDICLFAVKR